MAPPGARRSAHENGHSSAAAYWPHHVSLSIDAPHVWHCISAVWVMRAIVWCSPHSGHWETSSKRLRQLTQRRRPGSWVGRSQGSPQFGHGARPRTLVVPVPGSAIVRLWRVGRPVSAPALTEPSISFAGEAADEETRGVVAVGA